MIENTTNENCSSVVEKNDKINEDYIQKRNDIQEKFNSDISIKSKEELYLDGNASISPWQQQNLLGKREEFKTNCTNQINHKTMSTSIYKDVKESFKDEEIETLNININSMNLNNNNNNNKVETSNNEPSLKKGEDIIQNLNAIECIKEAPQKTVKTIKDFNSALSDISKLYSKNIPWVQASHKANIINDSNFLMRIKKMKVI